MEILNIYLPILGFFAALMLLTFATSPDRAEQVQALRAGMARLTYFRWSDIVRYFTLGRIIRWALIVFLLSFVWAYMALKSEMKREIAKYELELDVGTIKIPMLAFFKPHFVANAGFSRRRRRERVDVEVSGNVFSGYKINFEETDLATLSKLTGKAFTFNYLSDIKVLRPAINAYMKRTIAAKQVEFYDIELFDNRGPYLLVILDESKRGGDVQALATKIAEGLYNDLTGARGLKVNQVVIKVIDPVAYAADKSIDVIARGKAGSY
jgi:hypothetical protein